MDARYGDNSYADTLAFLFCYSGELSFSNNSLTSIEIEPTLNWWADKGFSWLSLTDYYPLKFEAYAIYYSD